MFLAFGSTPVLICMVLWLEISRRGQTLCWPRSRFSWMTRKFCLMKWRLGDNRLWQRPTCVRIYQQNTELIKVLYILRDGRDFFFTFFLFLSTATVNELRMLPSLPNDYRIDEVKVTKTIVNNAPTYEVTLVPFDCGYKFPKFQSVSGQVPRNF